MTTLKQWVEKRQEEAPTGSVVIVVSEHKTDYLSGDPGTFKEGEQTITLSFESPESSAFNGAVRVRLSNTRGIEATAFRQPWKPVKVMTSFEDGNPSGGTLFYISVESFND